MLNPRHGRDREVLPDLDRLDEQLAASPGVLSGADADAFERARAVARALLEWRVAEEGAALTLLPGGRREDEALRIGAEHPCSHERRPRR